MKEEGLSPLRDIRSTVVWVLDSIRETIRYFKWYRPMGHADPRKRLEKEILFELVGARYGGMAMNGAHLSFRKDYYDKLATDEEKRHVRDALLRMLRSGQYDVTERGMVASICSGLNMEVAYQDIVLVQEAAARSMSMRQLYRFKRAESKRLSEHGLEYTGTALSRG